MVHFCSSICLYMIWLYFWFLIYDVFVIRGIVMAGGFGSRILFGIAMGHDDGSIRIGVGKVRGLLYMSSPLWWHQNLKIWLSEKVFLVVPTKATWTINFHCVSMVAIVFCNGARVIPSPCVLASLIMDVPAISKSSVFKNLTSKCSLTAPSAKQGYENSRAITFW